MMECLGCCCKRFSRIVSFRTGEVKAVVKETPPSLSNINLLLRMRGMLAGCMFDIISSLFLLECVWKKVELLCNGGRWDEWMDILFQINDTVTCKFTQIVQLQPQ